jgi:hypothetical protein
MAPRPYQQHGLNHLKRRLKVRGLGGIDRRSKAARALSAWRIELEDDLGGPRAISAQERVILDAATSTRLLVDSLDRWLLEHEHALVNQKRRAVYPVVLQRQQLVDSLVRQLLALGLKRRQAPAKNLSGYLAEKYGSAERKEAAQDGRREVSESAGQQ